MPGEKRRVDLSFPSSGRFIGRLVAPEGRSVADLRVWVRPEVAVRDGRRSLDGLFQEAITLDERGTFETGPLRSGQVSLFLFMPKEFQRSYSAAGPPDFFPSGALHLGRFTIPPGGDLREEISLVDRFPARLRFRVTCGGSPLIGAQVLLSTETHVQLEATTDVNASVDVPVLAGSWSISVYPPDRSWSYCLPDPVTVGWGDDEVVEIDASTSTATLTFMDTTSGEPLGRMRIGSRRAVSNLPFKHFVNAGTTDDEGRLAVTRTPGEYLFAPDPWTDKDAPEVQVSWTSRGPELDEVWF